jgi:hypothetical protein
MKEGAIIGALAAFFVYMLLPIYGTGGAEASLIPTANVVSDPSSMASYVNNLPFSMVVFFSLEVIGISVGIASQYVLKKPAQ